MSGLVPLWAKNWSMHVYLPIWSQKVTPGHTKVAQNSKNVFWDVFIIKTSGLGPP